jgi:arylsulfatase A-like enzyme
MPMTDTSTPIAGPRTTLGAAAGAACATGGLWGLADALTASSGYAFDGALEPVACVCGSIFVCVVLTLAWLVPVALLLHGWLARRSVQARVGWLYGLGAAPALFIELYWWSRPYVFPGRAATSPERLVATLGLALVAVALAIALAVACKYLAPRARSVLNGVFAAGALVGLCVVAADAWREPGGGRGAVNERNARQANVLLVVVDALRADMLGCYGHPRVQTPHIDALAARGVLFERAYAQAPFTGASFGSIFTGKYPRRHGLVKMGPEVRMKPNPTLPWHLKSAAREAGGTMRDEDYATATFMTGALNVRTGLMRGFDAWFEALDGHELVDGDSAWSRFRSNLLPFLFKNKLTQRFDAELVASEASRWIESMRGKRWCAMVHLYSTHTPYDPPTRFREPYCDPTYAGPIQAFYAHHREAIERGDYVATEADVAQIRHLYEAGVAHADAMVGQLVAALEASGALADTLVILTSDHGENLGEIDALTGKALWEHNHMNELNLRVPLVLSWPGGLAQGKRVGALAESVDILPTVCDLFDLELPAALELPAVYRAIDGHSLLPLVSGTRDSVRETSYSENWLISSARDSRHRLVVARAALKPGSNSTDGSVAGHGPWLYDAETDPTMRRDIAAELPELRDELWRKLRTWSDALPIPLSDVVHSARDDEQRDLLFKLGYAGLIEQQEQADPPSSMPSPKAP